MKLLTIALLLVAVILVGCGGEKICARQNKSTAITKKALLREGIFLDGN